MTPTDVLIIDDSKTIIKLLTKVLLTNKISNYFFQEDHIFVAYDGMQAIEMLSKYPHITLLISDIMMPELSGHELIEILIDTQKIENLDVIFITTPINKSVITKKITPYIKGVIYKPFTPESFVEFFDNLQATHKKELENRQKIKQAHIKQMKYIKTWAYSYCDEEKIEIDSEMLDALISGEFNHFDLIDDDELYMICQIVLESYLKNRNNSLILNSLAMEKIYNIWRHPEKYSAIGIIDSFENIILNTQTFLEGDSVKELTRHSFILPLNRLLTKTRDMAKVKQKLPYKDFMPFFEELLDLFIDLDPNYKNIEVISTINHIKEINGFENELKAMLSQQKLIETFPFLKEESEILADIQKHIGTCIKYIEQQIIPYFIFKANELAWQNAKRSTKIVSYLKNNMKFKHINTHNLLHQKSIISRIDIKRFQEYDKEKIVLASRDLEILELFKKRFATDMPSTEILIFKSISILNSEFEKYSYKRVVVDLSFTNAIFEGGFSLVKLLNKKFVEFQKIVERGGLYLLVTPSQKEKLENSNIKLRYKILLKPLDSKKIFEQFYLEN